MCRVDYDDGDEGFWRTKPHMVKARKEHRCGDCGRDIAKGEHYWSGVWLAYGSHSPMKMCVQCHTAGRWLRVVCGGHFWPGVIEELEEHWDEEWELRSHGLGRLVKVGKSRWQRNGELIPVATVNRWVDSALSRVPESARH